MMSTKRKYKSAALEAIYSAAEGLFKAGGISKETMLDFSKNCLIGPRPLASAEHAGAEDSLDNFLCEEPMSQD